MELGGMMVYSKPPVFFKNRSMFGCFKRDILGTLGRVHQQLFPKYDPYFLYKDYIIHIYSRWYMLVYISGTLPRVPNFSLGIFPTISPFIDLKSSSNWRCQPFISMVGHQLPGVFVDVTSNISWLSKVTGWRFHLWEVERWVSGNLLGCRKIQVHKIFGCSLRHRKVTVDGSEIRNNHRKGCIKPCNGRTIYQAKLVQDFSYRQYHTCLQRYNV